MSKEFVVLGEEACTFEAPTNAVRWVERKRTLMALTWVDRVLQQRWTVTSTQGAATYMHEEWRDVPIVEEDAG